MNPPLFDLEWDDGQDREDDEAAFDPDLDPDDFLDDQEPLPEADDFWLDEEDPNRD